MSGTGAIKYYCFKLFFKVVSLSLTHRTLLLCLWLCRQVLTLALPVLRLIVFLFQLDVCDRKCSSASQLAEAPNFTLWSQWLTEIYVKVAAVRLIRPIIPLWHGKWMENLSQPDANRRKQVANTLGPCQLTQTYSQCTKTLFTPSLSALFT